MVLFSSSLDKLSPWLEGGIKLWLVFVRSLHEDQVLSFGSCFRVQVRIQKILSYHKGQCSDKIRSLALSKFFTVLNPNNWRRRFRDRRWFKVEEHAISLKYVGDGDDRHSSELVPASLFPSSTKVWKPHRETTCHSYDCNYL